MAIFPSTFFYTLTPGGTNQYTINGQIPSGQAAADAGDDTLTVNESVAVNFTTANSYDGTYTYIGHEPGLAGIVAQDTNGDYFLFANNEALPNQNFNIQANDLVVCFLTGTLIATPDGERTVESLAAGDLVLTADLGTRRVRWIGRQTVVAMFTNRVQSYPVRIAAGALGEDLPRRDLFLSPSHALVIDGVLVHASALINGTTIHQVSNPEPRFTFFHIETEDHAVILAEGVPAETFVDNVTRRRFDNFAEFEALFGESDDVMIELGLPRAMSPRQLPAAIRERIAARARILGPDADAA
ncbi:Hint domain-containing protein [Humitalea sp. 24SJ18S-53]|uniref:Hint domain-containing protein n=1 Tax=Humitalea sp. 24SJ18S-53 TaxID=3422307 RepID=UPI003D6714C5